MIKLRRNLKERNRNLIDEIVKATGVSEHFAEILISRSIDSGEKAFAFLHPSKNDLSDPYSLAGMKEAVGRLNEAKENGETVVVYGDYDADGISAVTTLVKSLRMFGIDAGYVIPERENGYGLTEEVLDRMIDEYFPDLVVTVDCGISAKAQVERLKDLGIDVIVTDHHEIPDELPECTLINCKLPGQSTYDGLCGAGVAYQLSRALIGEKADSLLDVVAVATVADSMPLTGDNRIIVGEGIKKIREGRGCKAIKAILSVAQAKEISSTALTFTIAPRVNAAGRMGDARAALELFLSEDDEEIKTLAEQLNRYNATRQAACDELYRQAKEKLKKADPKSRIIALYDDEWKSGLIGIVAAKLVEEYNKPAILFTVRNGVLHGSARSPEGINVFDALSYSKETTEEFGGHAQAAGVTIRKENLPLFEEKMNEYLSSRYLAGDFRRVTEAEELIDSPFDLSFAHELELLEPTGVENRKPLFAVSCGRADASPIKFGSPHISFRTPYIDLLYFGGYGQTEMLNADYKKTIVFEPNISSYNGRESLKGYVRKVETVAEDSEAARANVFASFTGAKGKNYTPIGDEECKKLIADAGREIYGTLFVSGRLDTLQRFPGLGNFDLSVLTPNGKGNASCVLWGIEEIPEGFGRVVYLDRPPRVLEKEGTEIFVNDSRSGFYTEDFSVDRKVFGEIFLAMKKFGKFARVADVFSRYGLTYPAEEGEFVRGVLEELGIIRCENGIRSVDPEVKAELTKSELYRAVSAALSQGR